MTTAQLTQEQIFETQHEAAQIAAAQGITARQSPGFEAEIAQIGAALTSGEWSVQASVWGANLLDADGDPKASMMQYAQRNGSMVCTVMERTADCPVSAAAIEEYFDRRAAAKREVN